MPKAVTPNVRLGAFIITRNRPYLLRKTLGLLLSQTRPPDHILVVDNGPSKETESVAAEFGSHTSYRAMRENLGPAGAAAFGLEQLASQGYDWIYWGDDDDPPIFPDMIERLLEIGESAGPDAGAVSAVGGLWDWTKGRKRRLPDEALSGVVDVHSIPGNGQWILRRQVVLDVGVPDPRLFFGLEELEYCLRIGKAGYRLLVDGDLMMRCRTRWGRLDLKDPRPGLPRSSYDALWRRYYSTRNYIFSMHRTFGRPDLARREAFKAIGRACMSGGRGPKYGSAFTVLELRAILDGYLGQMGRTVTPTPKYAHT